MNSCLENHPKTSLNIDMGNEIANRISKTPSLESQTTSATVRREKGPSVMVTKENGLRSQKRA